MSEFINEIPEYLIIVLLPLILTNVLHMLLVKFNLLPNLAQPIHTRFFGENKTWRGFLFVPIVNAILLIIIVLILEFNLRNPLFIGSLLGLAYVLFELPNSFLKRKLGIKSGQKHDRYKIIFSMFDKMDSALGVALVYFLLGFIDFRLTIFLFLFNSLIHAFLSSLLVVLKVKKSF